MQATVAGEPDGYELYYVTRDPLEERSLADPTRADERSRALHEPLLSADNLSA